ASRRAKPSSSDAHAHGFGRLPRGFSIVTTAVCVGHPARTCFMRYKLLCAALLAAVSPAVLATGPDPLQASSLHPVVVTATRVAQPVADTLAPVTVITREDIERLQPASVPDLLAGRAGITVANSGGLGQLTSLFMRGTNNAHTLVLID